MPPEPAPPRRGFLPALQNRIFAAYIAGFICCAVAIWVQRTAIGWLTWELTGSGSWLGAMAFAYLIPLVLIGPFGGVFADRFDRMRVITLCQAVLAAAALLLAVLAGAGVLTVWWLLGLTLLQGVTEAFSQPAQLSLVPNLVPRKDLTSAVATSAISFNTARFLGPALAGGLIAWYGVTLTFAVAAAGFVAFLLVLLAIYARVEVPAREAPSGGVLRSLLEGAVYTARDPAIGALMLLIIALGAFGRSVTELFPGFADAVYHSDARGLAALTGAGGLGAVLAGIRWSGARTSPDLPRAMLTASLVSILVLWAFLLSPTLYIAAPVLVAFSYCTITAGITTQTMINLIAEDRLRGRVLSFYGVCFRGTPALGALAMGVLADWLGLRWPVLTASLLLLLSWLLLRRRILAVRGDIPDQG